MLTHCFRPVCWTVNSMDVKWCIQRNDKNNKKKCARDQIQYFKWMTRKTSTTQWKCNENVKQQAQSVNKRLFMFTIQSTHLSINGYAHMDKYVYKSNFNQSHMCILCYAVVCFMLSWCKPTNKTPSLRCTQCSVTRALKHFHISFFLFHSLHQLNKMQVFPHCTHFILFIWFFFGICIDTLKLNQAMTHTASRIGTVGIGSTVFQCIRFENYYW